MPLGSLVVACVALLCDFCWKRYGGCEGDFQLRLPQKPVLRELRQVQEIPADRVILKLPPRQSSFIKMLDAFLLSKWCRDFVTAFICQNSHTSDEFCCG